MGLLKNGTALKIQWFTLWFFQIAMDNDPFMDDLSDDLPLKKGDLS